MTTQSVVRGLTILETYMDTHIAVERDILYAGAGAAQISDADLEELKSLGWFLDVQTGNWAIYV